MRLHTRAIVKGRNEKTPFWNYVTDFGIEFQPCHEAAKEHPKVKEALAKMAAQYPVTAVEFRDC